MKIADFFVQITAKGDLKELKMIVDAQKAIKEQSKMAVAAAKVKVAELKKETVEIQKQAKQKKEEPKTLKEILIARGKAFSQQNKINMLLAKGVLQTMGLTGAFMAATTAIIGTTIAIDKMVTKLTQANQLYTNFQRQTGMSMQSAMGMSAAMAGLDVTMSPEEVMQNMQNMQNNLVGIQFGMGNIAPYQMAGINPFGINSANMMDVIRKQLKGFAPAYRTFLLQQMGLDPRLGALIDLSDTEYLKYKQEALELYLSPADRKMIQELAPEWNKVNLKFAKSWDKITLMLMKDFEGFATEIGHLIDVFIRVLEIVNTIFKPLLDILTMFLKPLYYILDDIFVWLLGGKSVLGEMLKGNFLSKKEWGNLWREMYGLPAQKVIDDAKDVKKLFDIPLFKILGTTPAFGFPMGVMKHLIPNNITNDSSKNLSMNNNVVINANSPSDGFSISNAVTSAFNPIIAQMVG